MTNQNEPSTVRARDLKPGNRIRLYLFDGPAGAVCREVRVLHVSAPWRGRDTDGLIGELVSITHERPNGLHDSATVPADGLVEVVGFDRALPVSGAWKDLGEIGAKLAGLPQPRDVWVCIQVGDQEPSESNSAAVAAAADALFTGTPGRSRPGRGVSDASGSVGGVRVTVIAPVPEPVDDLRAENARLRARLAERDAR